MTISDNRNTSLNNPATAPHVSRWYRPHVSRQWTVCELSIVNCALRVVNPQLCAPSALWVVNSEPSTVNCELRVVNPQLCEPSALRVVHAASAAVSVPRWRCQTCRRPPSCCSQACRRRWASAASCRRRRWSAGSLRACSAQSGSSPGCRTPRSGSPACGSRRWSWECAATHGVGRGLTSVLINTQREG